MTRGTEKYQWVRATLGSVGLVALIASGPVGLLIAGGCVAVGCVVKYKEKHDIKAQLEDEEEQYSKNYK